MLLDRHRLLDVVTGGDIAELEKRDGCIHLARVALQLTVVSRTLGLSNVMPLDVLNTPSVEFYIASINASAIIEEHIISTCTSALGVNKLDVLPTIGSRVTTAL